MPLLRQRNCPPLRAAKLPAYAGSEIVRLADSEIAADAGSEIVRLRGQRNCPPCGQLKCSRCEQSGCFFHKTHTAKTHKTHKNCFRVFAENDPFFSTFILGDRGNFSTAKMRREMPKNGKIFRFSTKPTPSTTVTANPIHKSQSFLCAFANDSKNAACGKFSRKTEPKNYERMTRKK